MSQSKIKIKQKSKRIEIDYFDVIYLIRKFIILEYFLNFKRIIEIFLNTYKYSKLNIL